MSSHLTSGTLIAGFRIDRRSEESSPYLVSPLTGRGKIERVLTFEALRIER